jgi:glucose-6-phosphate 1-dehydrogenase
VEQPFLTNPLRAGVFDAGAAPCSIVIFGATGDLTQRKLIPALYSLYADDPTLRSFLTIVGAARRPWNDDEFIAFAEAGVKHHARHPYDPAIWQTFATRLHYQPVEFHDAATYVELKATLAQLDEERGTGGNRIFYLSTAPEYYEPIAELLGETGLAQRDLPGSSTFHRLLIEKPFGQNLRSAIALNDTLNRVFSERQVYRIDHYLGKETVQNILVMRFSNRIFEPLWSAEHIDNVQITVAESIGVESGRGGYYDQTGALQDMIQNHLMQLLTLVAMDKPLSLQANDVRQRKIDVLRAIRPMTYAEVAHHTVRAQYLPGAINYQPVKGYRQEERVAPDSLTETYVALRLLVETDRWAGVPFYLRTGKRLPERISEIAIKFKRPRFPLFKDFGEDALPANTLLIRIQPAEGISLRFDVKLPGPSMQLRAMNMDFAYGKFDTFTPEAYERLLFDAMHGDSTLFTRREETELAWEIVEAIARGWQQQGPESLAFYDAGRWGPHEAAEMIRRDKRSWRRL